MIDSVKGIKEHSKHEAELNSYLTKARAIVLKYSPDALKFVDASAELYQYRLLDPQVQQEFATKIAGTLRAFIGPPAASELEKELRGF